MRSDSVFIPRGWVQRAILLWASSVGIIMTIVALKAARYLSIIEYRLPGSSLASRVCLGEQGMAWVWAWVFWNGSLLFYVLFGPILPVLVQVGLRALWRWFKRFAALHR